MTLIRTFPSACELAQRLPALLASFMELEAGLSRRFREDSLSDLVIAAFMQLGGLPVAVLTPDEVRTGSDFDLELVDPVAKTTIRYRIQAKRLGVPRVKWQNRSYHHLAHPKNTGLQAATLCAPHNLAGPIPTIPLYAFFNPEAVCTASGLPGIALADAFEVEQLINNSLTAKPRPLFKRITAVQDLFFGLDDILCPPSTAVGKGIATPKESRDNFERRSREKSRDSSDRLDRRETPQPGTAQPEQLKALNDRDRHAIIKVQAERPRVIVATNPL